MCSEYVENELKRQWIFFDWVGKGALTPYQNPADVPDEEKHNAFNACGAGFRRGRGDVDASPSGIQQVLAGEKYRQSQNKATIGNHVFPPSSSCICWLFIFIVKLVNLLFSVCFATGYIHSGEIKILSNGPHLMLPTAMRTTNSTRLVHGCCMVCRRTWGPIMKESYDTS